MYNVRNFIVESKCKVRGGCILQVCIIYVAILLITCIDKITAKYSFLHIKISPLINGQSEYTTTLAS